MLNNYIFKNDPRFLSWAVANAHLILVTCTSYGLLPRALSKG